MTEDEIVKTNAAFSDLIDSNALIWSAVVLELSKRGIFSKDGFAAWLKDAANRRVASLPEHVLGDGRLDTLMLRYLADILNDPAAPPPRPKLRVIRGGKNDA